MKERYRRFEHILHIKERLGDGRAMWHGGEDTIQIMLHHVCYWIGRLTAYGLRPAQILPGA